MKQKRNKKNVTKAESVFFYIISTIGFCAIGMIMFGISYLIETFM